MDDAGQSDLPHLVNTDPGEKTMAAQIHVFSDLDLLSD